MIFISPQPNKWYEIYQQIKSHWEKEGRRNTPPPVALVLSGWTFSNDYDKKERWESTLAWAEQNNFSHLIPNLKEEEKYYVDSFSSYRPLEYTTYDPKEKPEFTDVNNAFNVLIKKWNNILDEEFGKKTKPLGFSGKKYRRLLVSYTHGYLPPWGSWSDHLVNGRPSTFTTLRKNVNELITPLEVDHIEFTEEKKN